MDLNNITCPKCKQMGKWNVNSLPNPPANSDLVEVKCECGFSTGSGTKLEATIEILKEYIRWLASKSELVQ